MPQKDKPRKEKSQKIGICPRCHQEILDDQDTKIGHVDVWGEKISAIQHRECSAQVAYTRGRH